MRYKIYRFLTTFFIFFIWWWVLLFESNLFGPPYLSIVVLILLILDIDDIFKKILFLYITSVLFSFVLDLKFFIVFVAVSIFILQQNIFILRRYLFLFISFILLIIYWHKTGNFYILKLIFEYYLYILVLKLKLIKFVGFKSYKESRFLKRFFSKL